MSSAYRHTRTIQVINRGEIFPIFKNSYTSLRIVLLASGHREPLSCDALVCPCARMFDCTRRTQHLEKGIWFSQPKACDDSKHVGPFHSGPSPLPSHSLLWDTGGGSRRDFSFRRYCTHDNGNLSRCRGSGPWTSPWAVETAWGLRTPRLSDRHRPAMVLVPPRQRQIPLCGVVTSCQHLRIVGWAWHYSGNFPNIDAG